MNPNKENASGKNFINNNIYEEDSEDEPVPMTYNLNHQKSYRNSGDKLENNNTREKSSNQVEYTGNKLYTFEAQGNCGTNSAATNKEKKLPEKNKSNAKTTPISSNLYAFERKLPLSHKVLNSRGEEIEIKLMPNSNSEKLVTSSIPSDVYLKPRKGDKTPKCALTSEKKEFREELNVREGESVSRRDVMTEREDLCFDNSIARQIVYKAEDSEDNLENEENEVPVDAMAVQNSRKSLDCVEKDLEHERACDINHRHYPQLNQNIYSHENNNEEGHENINRNASKMINEEDNVSNSCKENSDNRLNTHSFQAAVNKNGKIDTTKQSTHNINLSHDKSKSHLNIDKPSPNNSTNNIGSTPHPNNASKLKSNTHNTSHQTNKSHTDFLNHFNQYDIQQLTYDLVKEYSHLKINNDEDFMKRMLFDVFKRQTKEERMDKIIEQNKIKINEIDRIKTFNRLIEDANRRLEAQENLESMKNKIFEQDAYSTSTNKKISDAEWEEIYMERFLKFKDQHEKWRHDQVLEKVLQEKKKEDEIVSAVKTKKVAQRLIDESSKRMFEVAERRQLKLEESMRKKEGNFYEEKNSIDERELTPTKFKKKKNVQKYNFMSDVSGNEKSDSEDKDKNEAKLYENNLQKSKDKNVKTNLKNKAITKSTPINNKLYKLTSATPAKFLKSQEKINPNTKTEFKAHTNSEVNNIRFERRINKTPNKNLNKDENLKLKVKEISKSANKKNFSIYNSNQLRYDIKEDVLYDHEKDNDEDCEENLPKPLRSRLGLDFVRLNDFKSNNNTNVSQKAYLAIGISNANLQQNLLYMPDHMASKLVDDILQNRLEK